MLGFSGRLPPPPWGAAVPPVTAVLDEQSGSGATSSPRRGPRPAEVPVPRVQVRGALRPRLGEPAEGRVPLPPVSGRSGGPGGREPRVARAGGVGVPAFPRRGSGGGGAGRAGRRAVERSRSDDALPALPGGGLRLESAAAAAAGGGGAGGSGQQTSGGGRKRASERRGLGALQCYSNAFPGRSPRGPPCPALPLHVAWSVWSVLSRREGEDSAQGWAAGARSRSVPAATELPLGFACRRCVASSQGRRQLPVAGPAAGGGSCAPSGTASPARSAASPTSCRFQGR